VPGEPHVARLWLIDFRCFAQIDLSFGPGLTVLAGDNGQGKTSLLEAVGWAARGRSFRGVPDAALVRTGCEAAILRAEVQAGERTQLLEAEVRAVGRNRVLMNRHPLARQRDLLGLVRVTVFSPDDLDLVKGGPSTRRTFLDELLVAVAPRYEAARVDFERVLKQRNALLRQGVRDDDDRATLAVLDEQLVGSGGELARGRLRLVGRLAGPLESAYAGLAGAPSVIAGTYLAEWAGGPLDESRVAAVDDLLRAALETSRRSEIERRLTLVGPHRDEWALSIDSRDSRTHASQGEQRSLALALRLAGHDLCRELTGSAPVLLLDDVFSELDASRAGALVAHLPAGQTLLTTAGGEPPGIHPERRLRIEAGVVEETG